MAELKNAKHEAFARAVASGETVEKAYVLAGYKANRGNAARLKADESVSKRIEDLMKASAQVAIAASGLNRADVIQMLLDDREMARGLENPQMGAAIKAAELIGKDLGMFKDESRGGTITDLVELFRAIAGRTNEGHLNGTLGQGKAGTLDLRANDPARLRGPDT